MRTALLALLTGSLFLALPPFAHGTTAGSSAPVRVLLHQFTYGGQPLAAGLELPSPRHMYSLAGSFFKRHAIKVLRPL